MSSLKQIRSTFLDYFAADGHAKVHSAPLVPQNDPTLMFVNAGMVPFKDYFTGAATPPYPRATSSQKCVRAGGKHNDLDNVGYTARHLTFFEMLGNFSFGDYFKDHAIESAWTLVTRDFGLDPKRLLVTVYIDDDEAAAIWKKVTGFSDDKIIRIAGADNFWAMGDNGPCGPCTEIFWDYGDHVPGGPPGSPDEDGDRFVEIWNNVFMQFEKENDEIVRSLPKPSVDTGMGLERMTSVLQGKNSVFDTDLFQTLIAASEDATSTKAEGQQAASHRVIADHLRSSAFLIADGVTPSNEGRGYVLRRIMRRAMRHAHLLGPKDGSGDPLMHRLVPTLVSEMGEAYPELKRAQAFVEDTLKQEEIRFRTTLSKGMSLFDQATAGFQAGAMLDGETAFTLYDTYGFPLDLTQDEARRRGFSVNVAGFEDAMAQQRARSREHWKGSGQQAAAGEWLKVRDRLGPTVFTGYDDVDGSGEVLALMKDGAPADAAETGAIVEVLFDATPFYAESGGQAGDHGTLEWPGGSAEVIDVKKQAGDLHVLSAEITSGRLEIGTRAAQSVDAQKRLTTRANHSAAHLLHTALKNVLGAHVAQKGQMVDAERARFDFSHNAPVTEAEIEAIEAEVNAVIRQNVPAETRLMAPEAAIEAGAIALFGEKYGDEVRVLTLGRSLTTDNRAYSVELCGGTHVARTGDIALFKVVQETGVAAGVRRIEGLTGEAARLYVEGQARVARGLARDFKVQPADVPGRVEGLQTSVKALEKQVAELKKQLALGGGSGGNAAPEEIGGVKLIARVLDGVDGKGLRGVAEDFRKQVGSGVVALIGVSDGKAAVTVAATSDMAGRVNAADLARAAVIAMGGQGAGGKPDFAQGGAPDGSKAEDGLNAVRAALKG